MSESVRNTQRFVLVEPHLSPRKLRLAALTRQPQAGRSRLVVVVIACLVC